MKINVNKKDLLKRASTIQSIVDRKLEMAILSHILIRTKDNKITISATDLEVSYLGEIPAEVIREGEITLPGKKLFDILRELPEDNISIEEIENNRIILSQKNITYNLLGLNPEDFPLLPDISSISTININSKILIEMIVKTIYSVSDEQTRYNLSGIYIEKNNSEKLRMVSTDGHRLSLIEREIENIDQIELDNGVLLPKKGMQEALKFMEEDENINIGISSKRAIIVKPHEFLVMDLLDGNFPDYRPVIGQEMKHWITLNRELFRSTIRRLIVISTDKYRGIKFHIKEGKLMLESADPDIGEATESVDIDYQGEDIEIGFNPRFFLDTLQVMKSEKVRFGFIDSEKPTILKGDEDKGFLSVIMPMRL